MKIQAETNTMEKDVKIVQTFWKEDQRKMVDWIPYDATDIMYPTFESGIIYELLPKYLAEGFDYFGVFSYMVRRKVTKSGKWGRLNPNALQRMLDTTDADVISFFGWQGNVQMIRFAEDIHNGFSKIMYKVLQNLGIDTEFARNSRTQYFVINANFWVAKPQVWKDYDETVLTPFHDMLDPEHESFDNELYHMIWQDSGYLKKKREDIRERLEKYLNVPYYPYHAFILERLPSIFLLQRNYECLQYC